jgi:hypothetical protein
MTDQRAMPPDLFHQLTLAILDRSADEGLRTIKSIRSYWTPGRPFSRIGSSCSTISSSTTTLARPTWTPTRSASTDGTGKHTAATWRAS